MRPRDCGQVNDLTGRNFLVHNRPAPAGHHVPFELVVPKRLPGMVTHSWPFPHRQGNLVEVFLYSVAKHRPPRLAASWCIVTIEEAFFGLVVDSADQTTMPAFHVVRCSLPGVPLSTTPARGSPIVDVDPTETLALAASRQTMRFFNSESRPHNWQWSLRINLGYRSG